MISPGSLLHMFPRGVSRRNLFHACLLISGCLSLRGQVLPVPIPGGTIGQIPGGPTIFFNLFFPGVGAGFNGINAEPHAIVNSNGVVALGYTAGTATDSNGRTYNIGTDIRVYQGRYGGAMAHDSAGGTVSARAHGTFVFI